MEKATIYGASPQPPATLYGTRALGSIATYQKSYQQDLQFPYYTCNQGVALAYANDFIQTRPPVPPQEPLCRIKVGMEPLY